MRALHCSWISFFSAFFLWFSITPIMPEVKLTLKLSDSEVWTSHIFSVAGTCVTRLLMGPACDKFGARIVTVCVLWISAVPVAFTGVVQNAAGLNALRLVIGFAGGAFVTCQYWSSRMFTREMAGTANAIVAGWGNLGGGAAQIVVGSVLFPLFKIIYRAGGHLDEVHASALSWRTVCILPSLATILVGIWILRASDDAPRGNYKQLKKAGWMPEVKVYENFKYAALNLNTWMLAIQYACCFGVELTMTNGAASYFYEIFDLPTEQAAAIASIFGFLNIFARAMGGFSSDWINSMAGMRGRLLLQTLFLAAEGIMVIIFATTRNLFEAIVVMVFFSVFVQASEGSLFAIVPYVDPAITGSVAGIVGAGGSAGAVIFGFGFRQLDVVDAFRLMGYLILGSTVISAFICVPDHAQLLWGKDSPKVLAEREGRTYVENEEATEEETGEVEVELGGTNTTPGEEELQDVKLDDTS